MSREREILHHIMEMKEDVAHIKATLADYSEVKHKIERHEKELIKIKLIRKIMMFILISIPTSVAAYVKIWKG